MHNVVMRVWLPALNEAGLMVLTEKFHLDRGYCCGNGCRHCPFDYDRVPEPRRSELLRQRLLNNKD